MVTTGGGAAEEEATAGDDEVLRNTDVLKILFQSPNHNILKTKDTNDITIPNYSKATQSVPTSNLIGAAETLPFLSAIWMMEWEADDEG